MPNDPWKNPYQYANPGLRNDVEVYSLGADGKSGGSEFDADIGSWDL
jgi:general secretion pathway protein G